MAAAAWEEWVVAEQVEATAFGSRAAGWPSLSGG